MSVPSLTGKSYQVARALVHKNSLRIEVQDSSNYNPRYPKGAVIEQDPLAGSQVKQDRKIYLILNPSGYRSFAVPDVIRRTFRQTKPALEALGFQIGSLTYKDDLGKDEVLEIKSNDKNIAELLAMTIDDAIAFFKENKQPKIVTRLQPLQDVGLGYVHLGQSSSTLSGGEAQRVKLASFLVSASKDQHTLFIFDEPTTGLHFHDIQKLLKSFNALIAKGHSIIVVEHNLELIKCADYIIDLGPKGGETGGNLVAMGTPEEIVKVKASETGKYLKGKL